MQASKLKIGLVLDDSLDKTDGVQQYILALGNWLTNKGHEVHYLVGETKRRDLPRIHSLSNNIAVRFNGNRMSMPLPASYKSINSLLRQEAFDVLHVQMPYSPFLAKRIIAAAPTTTAVIGTFHILPNSSIADFANRLLALWLKKSLARFDAIMSVSPAAAGFAQRTYGIHSNVLPNVVDYSLFHSAIPMNKYKDGKLNILFLGRLVPRKGCALLLEAVKQLLHSGEVTQEFRLLICGKGPLEQSLKKYVIDNGLTKYVEFTGFVPENDKPNYYASADIAVFPSSGGESFGIVLIEAMAGGKAAVLAGNNPGYASVIGDRKDLLFNPRDAQELASKLQRLIVDQRARNEIAGWGENYSRQYDVNKVAHELVGVYKQALHSRNNMR